MDGKTLMASIAGGFTGGAIVLVFFNDFSFAIVCAVCALFFWVMVYGNIKADQREARARESNRKA